jgi:dipeptidyl aminopeptidase/acylaminoacyl peptidase
MEHAPATLLYTQALDGGDPKNKAEFRDQLFAWDAPFAGEPRELFKLKFRDAGTDFLETVDGRDWMLSSEYDRDRKWITTRIYDAANPAGSEPRVLTDRSINDRYNDPGSPLRTLNSKGRSVIRVQRTASGPALLMSGSGATPEGDRPFLDLMPLDSLKPQRLWRSEASGYESVVDVMADGASFITSFESPSDYPNYFSRTLNLAAANASPESAAGARAAITSFADPVPQVRDVKKELIKYTRSDGVELSGTLYLPPGYDKAKDGPLPLFLWAYPLEFTDKSTAGQVSSTPTTFTRMGGISHLCLVFAGYAVLDDATMPVIGDPETVNDTFVQQIVSSAQAAIDKCVELGVADRDRVAVGGHSYGAFMTANLLAHSELFRAGVARSGAYNRTLTPFGFQGERRTFWEAGDTYNKMSPFTYADKIKTPLLMIHGQIDNNPGTFPMQSERLFAAIKGLGGTAKLVMLPFESHGYSAMESALHVQAETVEWLDRYVKPAKQPSEGKATERTGQ